MDQPVIHQELVGDTIVKVSVVDNGAGPTFIVPHSNETSAVSPCGIILNGNNRRISFTN
jgi:hypothetical protein